MGNPKEFQGVRAKVRQECSELGPARAVASASAALGARRNVPGPARAPRLVILKSNLQHPNPDASTTQSSDQSLLPVPPPHRPHQSSKIHQSAKISATITQRARRPPGTPITSRVVGTMEASPDDRSGALGKFFKILKISENFKNCRRPLLGLGIEQKRTEMVENGHEKRIISGKH